MSTTLIIPGLRSSGPTHWQTWFERRVKGSTRVTQRDWNDPHLPDWAARVRHEISRRPGPIFIAAHSFGVLAAVQAASDYPERIGGALLVAPADPEHFRVSEFLPARRLGFPTVVVASTNDPWMSLQAAEHWARVWGADLVNLGEAGHINADAGFGPWPEGLALLERLRRAAEFRQGIRTACCVGSSPIPLPGASLFNPAAARFQPASGGRRCSRYRRRGCFVARRRLDVFGPNATIAGGKIATPL